MVRLLSRSLFNTLLLIAIVTCLSQISYAGSKETQMIRFKGEITAVSEEYLIVSKKKVILVNVTNTHKDEYGTDIRDVMEKPVQFRELAVGKWVEVLGQDLRDGDVRADIIYLLPHEPLPD